MTWLSASNAGYYVKDPPNPDPEALPLLSLYTIGGNDTNLAAGKVVAFGFPKPILEFLDPDGNVLTEEEEENPGVVMIVNNNDSNEDSKADNDFPYGRLDPQMVPMTLEIGLEATLDVGRVKLESNQSGVRVWDPSNWTTPMSLPHTWDMSNSTDRSQIAGRKTFYLEAITPSSSARDTTLTLSYTGNRDGKSIDSVKLTLLPVDIDFIHPETGEMNESRESSEGGYIAIRRDEQTPVTKLKLRKLDGIANAQFKLVFSSGKMKLWKDAGRTQAVESDSTTFPGNQDTELFFEGVEKSSAAKDIEIGLKVKIGSTEETAAKARATVVQAEFPVILRAFIPYKWTQPLEEYEGWNLPPFVNYTIAAEGDKRGLLLNDDDAPFRVKQKIEITPFEDLHTQADISQNRLVVDNTAPLSRHFDKHVAVPINERGGVHGYNLISGISPRHSGEPSLSVLRYDFQARSSSRNVTYRLQVSAEDGALPWYVSWATFATPNIDWKYDIKVDCTDPVKPKINAKGERDGFPAYEILAITSDGTIKEVYYWRPPVNAQAGPDTLTTPSNIDVTVEVPC